MAAYSTIILHHFVVVINSKNIKGIPTLMCSSQPSLGACPPVFLQANFPLNPRKVLVEHHITVSKQSFVVALLEMAEEKTNLAGLVNWKMTTTKIQERQIQR